MLSEGSAQVVGSPVRRKPKVALCLGELGAECALRVRPEPIMILGQSVRYDVPDHGFGRNFMVAAILRVSDRQNALGIVGALKLQSFVFPATSQQVEGQQLTKGVRFPRGGVAHHVDDLRDFMAGQEAGPDVSS